MFPMSVPVITGIGLALPPGLHLADVTARAVRGESGIRASGQIAGPGGEPVAAGEVPPFETGASLRLAKNEKFFSRPVACAMRAALDAVAAAGGLGAYEPHRVAIYTGSGQTGLEPSEFFAALEVAETGERESTYRKLGGRASRLVDRYWSLRTLSNAGLGLLAAEFAARGPSSNFVQGETASAHALDAAYYDLIEGRCDVALAGGYDCLLTPSTYLAYQRAGMLSSSTPERAYRPFDRERDGMVLGEGAAFVVMEREEQARARGRTILAHVRGVGLSQNSMGEAAHQAANGARPDLVIARGVGTQADDRRDAHDIAAMGLADVPVTALKGFTSYIGAATAIAELCVGILAARQRIAPPIARFSSADADCPLTLVAGQPRTLAGAAPSLLALSGSWSGQCAAIAADVPAA
jgi:3-oxoacyl-(acyl-carrier-protein) synthase